MILHLSKQIEATRVKRIHRAVTLSMTLAFLSELVGLNAISQIIPSLLVAIFWIGYYALLFHALKKMLYSFLTLQVFALLIHLVHGLFAFFANDGIVTSLQLINVIICFVIIYTVNRPIFYPKINWTEYDFRHRKDRRVKVHVSDELLEDGRLYDVRRGEAALLCFSELELDDLYRVVDESENYIGEAKILSKRKTLLGRPVTYGVKLVERT